MLGLGSPKSKKVGFGFSGLQGSVAAQSRVCFEGFRIFREARGLEGTLLSSSYARSRGEEGENKPFVCWPSFGHLSSFIGTMFLEPGLRSKKP